MNEHPPQQRSQSGVLSDTPPPATEVPICTRMVAWRGNVLPNHHPLTQLIEWVVCFRYHPNAATYSRTPTPSSERFHTLDKKYHLEAVEATPQVTCTLDRYPILFNSSLATVSYHFLCKTGTPRLNATGATRSLTFTRLGRDRLARIGMKGYKETICRGHRHGFSNLTPPVSMKGQWKS